MNCRRSLSWRSNLDIRPSMNGDDDLILVDCMMLCADHIQTLTWYLNRGLRCKWFLESDERRFFKQLEHRQKWLPWSGGFVPPRALNAPMTDALLDHVVAMPPMNTAIAMKGLMNFLDEVVLGWSNMWLKPCCVEANRRLQSHWEEMKYTMLVLRKNQSVAFSKYN